MRLVLNIIWLLFAGSWLAVGHILTTVAMTTTSVGIPLAPANLTIVPIDHSRERR
jgi:uncharacterized membrane protein YccF (DUF307 family)